MSLERRSSGSLLENICEMSSARSLSQILLDSLKNLSVSKILSDAMDYWEREFAFGKVFGETFVELVLGKLNEQEILADRENQYQRTL